MTTGERIQAARKKAGLTQEQLAQKIDSATITIRQYESGKREPRIEQLRKIASALEVSLLYLLGVDLPGISTLDEAVADYKESKKEEAIRNGLRIILEAMYGKSTKQIVSGKWMSVSLPVYGEGEKAIAIEDDHFYIIQNAIQTLIASLVSSFGKNAETAKKQLVADLSSPEAESFFRGENAGFSDN